MRIPGLARREVAGVTGELLSWPFSSDLLGRSFDASVWLPEGYHSHPRRRWPVVYFFDGHNLYDPAESSYGGVWHADRALARVGAIGIGVPCHPTERVEEYSPHLTATVRRDWRGLGAPRAATYLSFLVEELRPAVDSLLRTSDDRTRTALVGSSCGGVMAAWCWARRPDVFGLAAVMSPALAIGGERLFDDLSAACRAGRAGRLHVDVGGREADGRLGQRYVEGAERFVRLLRSNPRVALQYQYDSEGRHHEAAWAARLPGALDFLFRAPDKE